LEGICRNRHCCIDFVIIDEQNRAVKTLAWGKADSVNHDIGFNSGVGFREFIKEGFGVGVGCNVQWVKPAIAGN
jgi:hypothetical protein